MPTETTKRLNKTQNELVSVACAKCNGSTAHKILLSADETGKQDDGRYEYYWDTHHQIIQCQGCKVLAFRKASSNSEDHDCDDFGETCYAIFEEIYPPRLEGRKGLDDKTKYLPFEIQQIYTETLKALSNSSPILSGIGLRALVEAVTLEKEAVGSNLFGKINDLVNKKILTPTGADTLHKIRTLGNAAAHEVKPHTEKQLRLAMDVIEHLLTDVYILPKRIDLEFN